MRTEFHPNRRFLRKRLFFLVLLLLFSCGGDTGLVRMKHAFGYSIPLPANYNPNTLHDLKSDSTGTVTYLQGESPGLTSLSVWVQLRELPMEDYFPLIGRIPGNWLLLDQQEPEDFTGQNSYTGWHERIDYRMELMAGDSSDFTRDLWVVGHESYFYSFFWTVPRARESELLSVVRPSMLALRFIPRDTLATRD